MASIQLPSISSDEALSASGPGHFGIASDRGAAHDFEQVMNGFAAARPSSKQGPSLFSQMVRIPAQAVTEGLANIAQPTPEGLSVEESAKFYTQKQIELSEIKTLQNMSTTVIRMVRKDLETLLNSK